MTAEALWRLDGKTALITGAGRGIGRAVATLFADADARIAASDIDQASVQAVADGIAGARAYRADISDEAEVEALFAATLRDFGTIDILVHVAAIFPKREFVTMTSVQWDTLQAVNTRGTFLVMREAVKAMRAGGRGGAIVNVSSVSGERAAVTHNSSYGASKAAMTNLTRSVALEVAGDAIRVNAILPGGVATEGASEATAAMRASGLAVGGPMTTAGRMPLGRLAEPGEIASACLFMASPAASYITGQALAVDGGFLIS